MKRILILIIGLISVAYGQSSPTSSKTRFVNGIYLGTKLDSYFNAADSNAIYWRADSSLMAKYKGTARRVLFASDTTSILAIYKKLPVIAWGNSLTFGTGATSADSTWTSQASRLSGYNFVNKGVAGETSSEILTRVYAESADTLLMPSVFWAMENNTDTARMTSSLDSFVAKINHNRWVAVAPILRSGNPIGNAVYDEQRKWTSDAFKRYGNHIIDMQYWLLNFGDGSANDNTDIANGVIPRSLRVDIIHFNDKGYRIVAQRILQQLAFFTQGDNTYTNSLSVSARQGTPILNGNGLFSWKSNNHSYINSFSATTPYTGGDTLTIQNSAGVVDIAPSNGSVIRTGFLPARTTAAQIILTRGSDSDTSQLAYVASGQIASASGDIIVTNGTNSTVNKNVDLTLATVNSSPATYGSATQVPQFTVDGKGRVTGQTNVSIAIPQSAVTNLTTDLAAKAAITGQQFTGNVTTTAGNGFIAGGSSFGFSPSATRGSIHVAGSTDRILSFGPNGSSDFYIFSSSSVTQLNTTPYLSFAVNGAERMSITTSGGVVANSSISSPKIIGSSSAPSVTLGANITGSVSVTGTDMAGTVTVTVTSASGLATLNELFTLTYNSAYSSTPHVVFSAASTGATVLQRTPGLYLKNSGTSSFQIAITDSYTTPASATYTFTYHVIQ